MPYHVLQPGQSAGVSEDCCALAVMAKAPRPGKVKTRLSPPLAPGEASALNICFIRDTTENIQQVTEASNSAGVVAYTPVGDESAFNGLLPSGFQLLPQRGEDFGERLLYACEDLFSCGFSAVCLIDSDSPTLPQDAFMQAVEWLSRAGDRMVLGGADDGGYYLIGVKRPAPSLVRANRLEHGARVCADSRASPGNRPASRTAPHLVRRRRRSHTRAAPAGTRCSIGHGL